MIYGRALELAENPDAHLEARLADALLYSGRYTEALEAFREIEVDDRRVSAWVYVKVRALEWVIRTTGIELQERDSEAAEELAGQWEGLGPKDADELATRVWECDAVSSLGWFNRARDFLDRDLTEEAKHAYLTAAVMHEGDVEAWVNVAILAGQSEDNDLFVTSAITGHRLNQENYMGEFARQLRATVPDPASREKLLSVMKQVAMSDFSQSPGCGVLGPWGRSG